jgi:hypothetical protein
MCRTAIVLIATLPYRLGMTRYLAILMMIFAWLLYGAMPALAECPICDPVAFGHGMASSADMVGMSGMAMPSTTKHSDDNRNPCSGDMAHVSFCAACLILPPSLAIDTAKRTSFSYPAPGPADPLSDTSSQPTAPPPRPV